MTDADYYRELLRPVFAGRKVVATADVIQGAAAVVPFLRGVGADRPFLLAGNVGTGPVPTADEAEQFVLGLGGDGTMMGGIRSFEEALFDLPAGAVAALDAYDPDHEAIILGSLFTTDGLIAGRRVYGGREKRWQDIEDKTVIDAVLAEAGIALAPSEVVALADARAAAARVDAGLGTAWAGDAREGWWGGASYFRWVRTDDDASEAETFLGASCDRVRVMPFLEGIPCSIHGIVFPDRVTAFRPVEMVTLRRVGGNRLLYASVDTFWDPPDADRTDMRAIARRVGETLRRVVGFRGTFTLDGVLTADGFRPTEVNPRPGAGLAPIMAACGVNISLLNKAIIEREPFDWRPDELEELVVTAADRTRGGGCFTIFPSSRKETETCRIAMRDGAFARTSEEGDGEMLIGPATAGALVRYVPDATRVPTGPSFAPTAVEFFAFTDAEFGTGIGPLEPARSVR